VHERGSLFERLALLALLVLVGACGSRHAALRADELLIVDADAGGLLPDGQRLGVLFRAGARGGHTLRHYAGDERWIEPVDALVLDDGRVLLLEQQWSPEEGEARGALFLVGRGGEPVEPCWSDPRLRQPVALARGPDGTLYVSDRSADPLALGRPTGCVFAVPCVDGVPDGEARVAAAGPELTTPGGLLFDRATGQLLLLDADSNPRGLVLPDGREATPGVLFALGEDGLVVRLQPEQTTSPIALIERRAGELYLVDANAGRQAPYLGDGALYRIDETGLTLVVDGALLDQPRRLVDPVGGDVLADGRLVLVDANADPLGLGGDGTGKGVYGTGHGAVLAIDPDRPAVETLLADERFVTPLAVRRVRP
jgi:hypothetical protein